MQIEAILQSDIAVHQELAEGQAITYGLDERVLRWLDHELSHRTRTLETGCGLSTMVFAANGAEHVCITPFADERDRVLAGVSDTAWQPSTLRSSSKRRSGLSRRWIWPRWT